MDDRIERLEREINALRTEINELRTTAPAEGGVAPVPDDADSKRTRRAMITGAAAAGVGAAALLTSSSTAHADDPFDLELGGNKTTALPTRANYNGGNLAAAAFEFDANQPGVLPNPSLQPPDAALLGKGGNAKVNGVEGTATSGSGVGMFAHHYAGGTALRAETNGNTAIRGESFGTGGIAISGVGPVGVAGITTGVDPAVNIGLAGIGAVGVNGLGATYGGQFFGNTASLFINPAGITAKAPPRERTDAHVQGELDVDQIGDVWYCTADGTPGTWRKVVGSATAGALHFLANLVRIYDSRASQPPATGPKTPINPGDSRTIDCTLNTSGVPVDATGVIATLTVADTTGRGNLAIYPDGQPAPTASSINYTPGVNIANTTIVGCGPGAKVSVACGGSTGCNFLIDIIGYFT
ncbi:MAG: hypothetical protein AAFY28_03705 [Actinomycetota bacterium]